LEVRNLTAIKRILVICARLVRDLNSSSALVRVFEEVDIRALVEPVMSRFIFGWAVEIVYIREASARCSLDRLSISLVFLVATHRTATFSSPGRAAISASAYRRARSEDEHQGWLEL